MISLSCFPYKIISSTLLKCQSQGLPVGDHDRGLFLEVYGLWAWPRWSWPPETNSNHSLLSSSMGYVSATLLKNQTQGPQGVSMTMLYSLRSKASGHGSDGHGLRIPTQTIHYYHPLQVLFQQLCWKINPGAPRECLWPCSTPWSLWPLGKAQVVLASRNQLKPFTFIIVYNFCLTSLPRKLIGNSQMPFH